MGICIYVHIYIVIYVYTHFAIADCLILPSYQGEVMQHALHKAQLEMATLKNHADELSREKPWAVQESKTK